MSSRSVLARAVGLARSGRLYPAVIVHGADGERRRAAAAELARALLCEREPAARPCPEDDPCRQCARIVSPAAATQQAESPFHPDFSVLWRDAKTVTSAEATREFLRVAHSAPFEARGQVFVVAEADTLSAEAGDALLKLLEEPGLASPRHFFLLAPSRLDLTPTLRSRSMALFLGPADSAPEEKVVELAEGFAASVARWVAGGGPLYLLEASAWLFAAGLIDRPRAKAKEPPAGASASPGPARRRDKEETLFDDPRAEGPWITAAAAVRRAALAESLELRLRRPLLALADDLLAEAPALRLRGIAAERILDGMVSRRLAT